MAKLSGISHLTAAARALRDAEGTDIIEQINNVSNALIQGHRERIVIEEGVGLPAVAKNVLENIKIQVGKSLVSRLNLEESVEAFKHIFEILEVIEVFVDRVVKHYDVADTEVSKDVKDAIAMTKLETQATYKLKKLHDKIQDLEEGYKSNPDMPVKELKKELHHIYDSVESIEKQVPQFEKQRPEGCSALFSHINFLKKELEAVFAVTEQSEHPRIVGEVAVNLLRMAVNIIQDAQTHFQVQQALEMAVEANDNLNKSSEDFKESGKTFNDLIEAKVGSFLDQQLKILEKETMKPIYCIPDDMGYNDKTLDRMERQKERLLSYFQLAKKWSGHRKEDFLERIAILFEALSNRAEKACDVLQRAANGKAKTPEGVGLSEQAEKFLNLAEWGTDQINPDAIFHADAKHEDLGG